MTFRDDTAPPAIVRAPRMGVNGLPDDRIEHETVSEMACDPAIGGRQVANEYVNVPHGAPTSGAWIAVGAVICGAAGALAAWSRSRRQEAMHRVVSAPAPTHATDVTPPHGDPLSPTSKRP